MYHKQSCGIERKEYLNLPFVSVTPPLILPPSTTLLLTTLLVIHPQPHSILITHSSAIVKMISTSLIFLTLLLSSTLASPIDLSYLNSSNVYPETRFSVRALDMPATSFGSFAPQSNITNSAGVVNAQAKPKWCSPSNSQCCFDPEAYPLTLDNCLWDVLGDKGSNLIKIIESKGYKAGQNWIEAAFVGRFIFL